MVHVTCSMCVCVCACAVQLARARLARTDVCAVVRWEVVLVSLMFASLAECVFVAVNVCMSLQ
jgi:hypothetical protein